jgi:hypothetical protein
MTDRIAPLVDRAEALEAEELRLLACAVGDHLPIELALRVQALEAERARLAGGLSPVSLSPARERV